MDTTRFEAGLVEDGYRDIETKALRSDYRAREHSHDFDVRALVLAGEITLTWKRGDALVRHRGRVHDGRRLPARGGRGPRGRSLPGRPAPSLRAGG